MTSAASLNTPSPGPAATASSGETTTAASAGTAAIEPVHAGESPVVAATAREPADAGTTESADLVVNSVPSVAASFDAASAEPADADGRGETVVDDPADADAPGSGAAGTSADAGTSGKSEGQGARQWVQVCRLNDLTPDRGRAALVGGEQVALFRLSARPTGPRSVSPDASATDEGEPLPATPAGPEQVYAIGNRDPFSGAYVLSRGVVGDKAGVPKVASPVFKQGFDLRNGRCLDDPDVTVPAYRVRVDDEWVLVEAPPGTGP